MDVLEAYEKSAGYEVAGESFISTIPPSELTFTVSLKGGSPQPAAAGLVLIIIAMGNNSKHINIRPTTFISVPIRNILFHNLKFSVNLISITLQSSVSHDISPEKMASRPQPLTIQQSHK